MPPVLTVRALRKSFTLHTIDGRVVHSLCGVDLDVRAGEHVALAGPSGAGKSSLLRCVNRTYLPDSGSVVLRTAADEEITLTDLPDRAMAGVRGREFGYVSQFLAAPPRTSPLEFVVATARRRGRRACRGARGGRRRAATAQPRRSAVGRGLLGALRRRASAGEPGGRDGPPAAAAAARRAGVSARPG